MNKDIKILIVDDMMQWIKFHQEILENYCKIDSENIQHELSAKAAFNNVMSQPDNYYDLIITDMQMEYFSDEYFAGEWLLKQLTQHFKCGKTKFLVISSALGIKNIAERFNASYIRKPNLVHNPMLLDYKLQELFTF